MEALGTCICQSGTARAASRQRLLKHAKQPACEKPHRTVSSGNSLLSDAGQRNLLEVTSAPLCPISQHMTLASIGAKAS